MLKREINGLIEVFCLVFGIVLDNRLCSTAAKLFVLGHNLVNNNCPTDNHLIQRQRGIFIIRLMLIDLCKNNTVRPKSHIPKRQNDFTLNDINISNISIHDDKYSNLYSKRLSEEIRTNKKTGGTS